MKFTENHDTAVSDPHQPAEPEDADEESSKRSSFGLARIVQAVILVVFVGVLGFYFYRGDITRDNLEQTVAALPTSLFLPAYLLLPLVGLPISIVLLASGMKYGFGLSIAIAVVGMGFHTFVAWHLAHGLFRKRIRAWLENTRFGLPTIPDHHQIWFTSLFVTVPGLPYAVKLYSLALTNLPFRRYLFIVWFFHVINAIPFIGIGIAAINFSPLLLSVFGVLALLTVLGTNWLKRKFSSTLENAEDQGTG